MKNNKNISFWALGLQFTSSILVPPIVCIYLGTYLQEKYSLGDWVMTVSVGVAIVLMFSSLYNFAKTADLISKKQSEQSEEKESVYELRKQKRD